jgi:hypothetical protein
VQLEKVSIYDWLGWRHGARLADVCQETLATECGRRLSSSFGTYGSCISISFELHKREVLCNRFARLLKVQPPFQGHRRYSAKRPGRGDFF